MRILLTGATGFLGSHVVRALHEAGHGLRAIVRTGAKAEALLSRFGVDLFQADLRQPGDLVPAFAGVDVLIHLAACLRGDDREHQAVTVGGTERLLEAMASTSTRRLLLASSFAVYDRSRAPRELTESSPLATDDLGKRGAYAAAKIRQEHLTRDHCDRNGWDLTVLRPGSIWGDGHLFVDEIGRRLGPLLFVVAPRRRLHLTYVENCAKAFRAAAERPEAVGQTFNVVDAHQVTSWRYAGEYLRSSGESALRLPTPYHPAVSLLRIAGASVRSIFRGRHRLPGIIDVERFEGEFKPLSCRGDALRQELGWIPRFSFEEAWARASGTPQLHGLP